ncbi:M12 family metallopeptidase [Paludisphaera mucosa]|uniref:M12 family metallopeptidase n=1 Tax=Paludisphaera mucosa TaxID=3030827 RepID=A0ABT6F4A1_9BACT|nr:M12 family metallopeptidase [Paludisphaera mucosa]MDG3002423.1 M12 family metallopeptidase [Paludisphaera mucosa]
MVRRRIGLRGLFFALIVVPSAFSPASRGQHVDHDDMFRTGPTLSMPYYDPRCRNSELSYSKIDGRVVVDGDLDLGTELEVLARSWKFGVLTADRVVHDMNNQGVPVIAALGLDANQEEKIRALAEFNPLQLPAKDLEEARERISKVVELLAPLRQANPVNPNQPIPGPVKAHAFVVFAGVNREFIWPGGKIPYVMDRDLARQPLIFDAMKEWGGRTGGAVSFVPRQGEPDYVHFRRGVGCNSGWVGRQGGEQHVTLSDNCQSPQILHELGHVLGLFHEQNRHDRATFLEIDEDAMEAGRADQFRRSMRNEEKAKAVGKFDWESIMLYPPRAFTKTGRPTMLRVGAKGDEEWGIASGKFYGGVTTHPSSGDADALKDLYKKNAGGG